MQDPPVDDDTDVVGKRGRVLEVMRDEDRRKGKVAEQFVQLDPDGRLGVGVECRQGLVEEQDAGIERERSGECNALSLTTGQLADPCSRQVRDLEAFEQLVDARSLVCAPKRTFARTSRWGKRAYSWNR